MSFEGEQYEGCAGDAGSLEDVGAMEDSDDLPALLAIGASELVDTHPLQLAEVDGKWYLSVIGSFLDSIVEGIRGLEPGDLEDGLDSFTEIFESGVIFGDDVFADDPFSDDVFTDDVFTDDVFTDDVFTDDCSPTTSTDDGFDAVDDCYGISDAEEAVACFEAAVAGGADPSAVPVPMRFPECGYAEVWWNFGAFAELTDDEFIEAVTAAHDCFQGLVDSGAIEDYEMPYDVLEPSCYGGINPYRLEGEEYTEATDAYSNCVIE